MASDEPIEQTGEGESPEGQTPQSEASSEGTPADESQQAGEPGQDAAGEAEASGQSEGEADEGTDGTDDAPAGTEEGATPSEPEGGSEEDDEDEFDVEAFFAAGANSPGAVTASDTGESSEPSAQDMPAEPPPPPAGAEPPDLPNFASGGSSSKVPADKLDLLSDVDLQVTIELGRTRMLVEDVLRLTKGSVVELEKLAGDPVDVFVNGRLVAKGEVLVLNDTFCVRVNELVSEEVESEMRRSA